MNVKRINILRFETFLFWREKNSLWLDRTCTYPSWVKLATVEIFWTFYVVLCRIFHSLLVESCQLAWPPSLRCKPDWIARWNCSQFMIRQRNFVFLCKTTELTPKWTNILLYKIRCTVDKCWGRHWWHLLFISLWTRSILLKLWRHIILMIKMSFFYSPWIKSLISPHRISNF